ncbi:MAG TPA: hydantoinase/oxoprolinase family protein, partial [Terriglobales bacterium]|nr:hydantoinase/oxoprolinase family protein [Terriglobales bacterium]
PGPACYGHGGPATVTDALVVLGRIPGDVLAGSGLALDRAAAARVLGALARALRLRDAVAAAAGVLTVADARMEAALRRVSVERAHDPRGAALVAFGGAGGLHACALAEALGAGAVLFPLHAGVLSALGALAGGSRRERSRSVLLDARDRGALERAWLRLEREARAEFAAAGATRSARGSPALVVERWAEVRYRGQSHEIAIEADRRDARAGRGARAGLDESFHREHERLYGFCERGRPVEVVTLEVRVSTPSAWGFLVRPPAARTAPRATHASTPVHWRGRWLRAPICGRADVTRGRALSGPAIVADEGATLWIAPGWRARAHGSGTIVVTRGRR